VKKRTWIIAILIIITHGLILLTGCSSGNMSGNVPVAGIDDDTDASSASDESSIAAIESMVKGDGPVDETGQNNTVYEYFLKITGNRPFAVAFDRKGSMYIVTAPGSGSGTLTRVSPDGRRMEEIATLEGTFIGPGLDIDGEGNIYAAVGDRVLKVIPGKEPEVVGDGFSRCFDVKADLNGNLFVVDDLEFAIYRIDGKLEKTLVYQGKCEQSFQLTSICFDREYKYLYAREADRLLRFPMMDDSTPGEPETVAEQLPELRYICMDSENNLYGTSGTDVIRKISNNQVEDIEIPGVYNCIGLASGGAGFDEGCLYAAASDGIVKVLLK